MPSMEIQISSDAHTELKRRAREQAKQMKRLVAEIIEREMAEPVSPPSPVADAEVAEIRKRHEAEQENLGDESGVHHGSFRCSQAHEDRATLLRLLSTRAASPGETQWRPITPADMNTVGWLYSPPDKLYGTGDIKNHPIPYDIQVSKPRDFTWATHIIPLEVPAPPVTAHSEKETTG